MTTETPQYDACCPVVATLDIIGGKWKVLILYHLNGQTRRFNELQRLMPAITQRMLTLQLREVRTRWHRASRSVSTSSAQSGILLNRFWLHSDARD